ncbi:hypothetical protein F2Q68_00031974 [Brassica cretica]|uniref:Uncharacterized protein n=1 Tax=Brassica cretica TaxID=69181 RepID=A0A8S9GAG7_BRACR|nr:hypothetical protein F2Q68_00031974 [Brassica cretica]
MGTHHGGRRSRSSRRLLGLRSSSPSEERWKLTTEDDSPGLHGVSSVFARLCRQRNDGNPPQTTTLSVLRTSPSSEIEEASNDDNSVVSLQPATMEKLKLFRGDTILIKGCL